MKVYVPCQSNTKIGGGFSFVDNLKKGAKGKFQIVDLETDCMDVALIPAPTLVTRDEFKRLKKKCPVVLRLDGIPEDWRNRGTGWPRLRDFAKEADEVIYQSAFVEDYVGRLINRLGTIIYNGVDTKIFNKTGERDRKFGKRSILYIHYRNDPNKRVDEAIARFRMEKVDDSDATMTFVGNYPKQQFHWGKTWDFGMLDLEMDKDWRYLGIITDKNTMAKVMRSHDELAFPSFADPCPNTLIEAICCGMTPIWLCDDGSSKEIDMMDLDWSCERMADEYLEVFKRVFLEKQK